MMRKLLATGVLGFLAAAPAGVTEVVRSSSAGNVLGVLVLLVSVTSLTFILVLLACGLRKPLF